MAGVPVPDSDQIIYAYAAIVTMAAVPIYIGAHLSLHTPEDEKEEAMTTKDAYMFPVIGSGVLFGLYMLFKMFNPAMINLLLTAYFLILGFISLDKTFTPLFKPLVPGLAQQKLSDITIPAIPYATEKPVTIKVTSADVVSWIICSGLIAAYVSSKNWILNNILGLSFSVQGVALFNLGSYKIGCILLGGLFFYDVFWVFGTDVMVSVAKSFDAPIKLLFPKNLYAEKYAYSMLGLGDIVIPGVFIALLLRYDFYRANVKHGEPWRKPYFNATFLGYVLGLIATIFVMHTFQAAQPALLYLVPFCIGFSLFTAFQQSDVLGLYNYEEKPGEVKEEKEKVH
jgi:minor histocompatibility antigen H13